MWLPPKKLMVVRKIQREEERVDSEEIGEDLLRANTRNYQRNRVASSGHASGTRLHLTHNLVLV